VYRVFVISILLLSVLGVALFQAGLAQAQQPTPPPSPSISVSPTQGPPGTSISVSGTNFPQNQSVTITFNGTSVGSASTGSGSWSQSFTVPASPSGTRTIEAGGATSTFTVTPEASLSTTSGAVGSQITVTGEGFSASEAVTIRFGNEDAASATADSNGSFSTTFAVPAIAAGTYTVSVGSASTVSFRVTSSFTVSPTSGPPGSSIQIRGSGFTPNSTVNLTIDGTQIQTITTNNEGEVSASVQIPVVAGGPRTISVSGGSGSGQATFDVTPTLTINSTTASPGATVEVSGTGFRASETGITLRFDQETVATGISADAQGRWTGSFTVPNATAGTHTIRASGPLTTSTVPAASLIVGAGVSLEQTSGPPGSVVRLTGSGVRARDRVIITVGNGLGSAEATANSQGEWSADLTIPPAPRGPLTISVAGSGGQAVETTFNVTSAITVSEPKGSPNSPIIVRGEGFGANQSGITITFGDEVVTSVSADPQGSWNTDFNIPPTPRGTYFIKASGAAGVQVPFTVVPGVSLSQPQAGSGGSATITGGGFAANETGITVTLGDTTVASGITANAAGSWSAPIELPPLPAGSYPITASGSQTSAGNVSNQTLTLAPHITLSSTSGAPGSDIRVSGRGFAANQQGISITYDGTTIVSGITADSSGTFTTSFVVPPSASGPHPVGIAGNAAGGGGSPDIRFQVMPSITLDPASGPPMGSMKITGSGFGANEQNIQITYDNLTVLSGITADAKGSFEGSFGIPPSPAGEHVVQAAGATSSPSARPTQRFRATPGIALSETAGNVGMTVRVIGRGFVPASTVTLSYDELTETEVTTDATGSFRLDEFVIPQSRQGEHQVRAEDESGNRVQATFAVENTPPAAPDLRSPENGDRGGLFGGFRPDARWTPVEDPSGVTYNLQVARDPEFTDIILEKNGLKTPFYTLGEEEALDRGQYYWRVRAVDGAANPGPFSQVYEVNSGIIPLWVIPAAIVLGLLASGGGAYAYYAYVYRPRKLAQEAPLFPDFVRITKPETPPPSQTLPSRPPPAPALAAPRRALPSPFRRSGRTALSPEDQARLQMVLDFVRSIPLLEVSPDLVWLEDLIEPLGGPTDQVYEQVLRGELEPVYQPVWTQHPTYMELQNVVHAQPFLQGLEGYIEAVNDCASDTLSLLRRIYRDVIASSPMETAGQNQWRFVVTVGRSTIAWFRGTYLGQPSTRDYAIKSNADADDEEYLASLYGEENSPFKGLIIEGMEKEALAFYRDVHIQLRNIYRTNEEARTLASKMTSISTMREQLMQSISQVAEQDQKR